MATCRELYDRYNIGIKHISPVAVEYPDGNFRSSYRCKARFGDILRDYTDHLHSPPTDRCRQIPVSYDGVIRWNGMYVNLTDEEVEWASIEYILRQSLNKSFGSSNFVEFIITIKEK